MFQRSTSSLRAQGILQGLFILLLFIGPFNCFSSYSQANEIIYTVNEGLPKGTLIGNIGADLKLDFSADPPLSFNLASKKISVQYVNLNNTTGELYAAAIEIDREALCPENSDNQACILSFDILILPQQYFRLVKVKIIVKDVNDNSPRFLASEIQVFVPENAQINSRFAIEHSAVDPDTGIHGVQTYWLRNDYGLFTLDVEENENGDLTPFLIVIGSLDRESKDEYVTDIIAEDGGTPQHLGTATLKIIITDVNDNCPVFTESQINVTVYGNAANGAHVTRVHAFDSDLGSNAQISYTYSERVPQASKALFNLDTNSGIIKISGIMDGNTAQRHKLTVLANGLGCIPAVTVVTVNIIKVFFNPPVVVPRYIASVVDGTVYLKESEPSYSPIAFFTIKDLDQKQKVDCHLEGHGPFRLSTYKTFINEYLLETTETLDYELKQNYELTVVAKNSQGLVVKTIIKVQLIDENDNPPVFKQSLVDLLLEENNAPNTFLTKLHATDEDSGEKGQVLYILGSDAPSVFTLDKVSGVLMVTTSLDREERDEYRFTVRAVDCGSPLMESIATVIITVLDRNDNSPRFINKDFSFFVPENIPGFGEIGVISVSDADSGKNGLVALSIVNGSDIFVIDTGKGVLRVKVPLDREQNSTYLIWIEAVDGGEPALSSSTVITVLLLDVNDNPPLVLFPQSNLSYMLVLPTTLPGSSITEVYAVDKDTGMNAVIAYNIIGRKGPQPESFEIDPDTGNITLQKTLKQNDCGLYRLLVKVSDHGQPEPLHSTVMVNLYVNETLSNESFIESLLKKEPDITVEQVPPERLAEPAKRKLEQFPCVPVLISLSAACLGLLLVVILMSACICLRKQKKRKHKEKRLEVDIPLNTNKDFQAKEKKMMEISNI
ncbi:protocadherin-20-like [Polyodon spathula]|nr:protocadherin-20-like [Polyodon spathula]